ncbi:bifunctional aldolase/short-chain dehydrogenase [Chelativorans salis]|uniref:Bifunctional aldolase/short-chain dehydrogenase n=1 Tax=Chelativorans salis TaxID=2978478 RepID=A0ABT2LIK6_9HYPH|nr:bifunctional aldolase/short-chain dehydrogenase [Chelativorans sp. EGI FJ00035]MCT7373647.1 bifunctional aldolase/short-chain dehydrogenase [Chelativorans sp. EGI FJ00035]
MQNLWNDSHAEKLVEDYAAKGVGRDLALRVYTTRLLGGEPRLVLHGGGNTSLKTRATDILGREWDVLCVKGSGWDMGVIEPAGLPAVKMDALLAARKLGALSDEDMVAMQRANLIDAYAPNPSIETLLHAFLPHKFVDHTHSTAILALVDQVDSEPLCREVFGKRMGFVPYIKPGFDLAKAAADIYDADPSVEGLILDKHGIFTFAEDAKGAYDLMIEFVTMAENYVARKGGKPFASVVLPAALANPAEISPYLRGALAIPEGEGRFGRMVSDFRTSPKILDYVNAETAEELAVRGVSTPDLSIRIKTGPMVLPAPEAGKLEEYGETVRDKVAAFSARYRAYFESNDARDDVKRTMLDPMPRLTLVRGLGLFGHGRSLKEAKVAADCGEMLIEAVTGAETVGSFQPLALSDLFELEYWSLEQAKLAANKPKALSGQVMLITGGAGAIGAATAKLFAAQGAHAVVVDLDAEKAEAVAKEAGNASIGVGADVTDSTSVRAAFEKAVEVYGGVDIAISNAGAAWQGRIGELDDATLRKSFELNFFAHQSVARNAVRIFRMQKTGGVLLFNTSKQAINPGANFGAYGLPKAATLFLSRQYALDYGAEGIRSNAVNADRIRSGLLTDEMIASRAKARGVSEKDYMGGNLLGLEVRAEDVAQAFLHQALAERTTADVTTVDGGNIAAALR